MKRRFLEWLYRRNEALFCDMMVESFYGMIPKSVREPAVDFLAEGRQTLERFFSVQAYHLQRRSIADQKNTQFYAGILAHIKSILAVVQKGRVIKTSVEVPEPEKDPIQGVKEFMKAYEEKNKKV